MSRLKPINADAFRVMSDHVFWDDASPSEDPTFRHGDVVFCKIDEVWRLFRALRRTRKRIVLVSGEGDKPVTPDLAAQAPPHVDHWFGTNMFAAGEKMTGIPLGLGNAGGTITLSWEEICRGLAAPPPRNQLVFANFSAHSNPMVRGPLLSWIQKPRQHWITTTSHDAANGKTSYLNQLLSHRFALCPPGNGEDTHRMWEALYCGTIPIVRESPAMKEFRPLPILFVKDFTDTSPALLENFSPAQKSRALLDAGPWSTRIHAAKQTAKSKGPLNPLEWISGWLFEIRRALSRSRISAMG